MAADQYYLECPLPNIRVSTAWIGTLSAAINDTSIDRLVRGHYDEHRHVVILPGDVLAAPPSSTADYLNADNFSTGLDIVSNTMVVIGNVTSGATTASSFCCSLM